MNLYIIRHAESANNRLAQNADHATFLATRNADPPITDSGCEQAQLLAEHLARSTLLEYGRSQAERQQRGYGLTRLVCSPMLRTLQTAAPVAAALGLTPEIWLDVFEQGGMFEGNPYTGEKLRCYPGSGRSAVAQQFPTYVLPAEWTDAGWWTETYEEMSACQERAEQVAGKLFALAKETPDARIGMITHGTFSDQLLKRLFLLAGDRPVYFSHYNTGITRVEFAEDYTVLRYTNRIAHLPEELITH
jgi:broad specificity phosphatase PhoE